MIPDNLVAETVQAYGDESAVILAAMAILEKQAKATDSLTSPSAVRSYLRLALQNREAEAFWCVWLDAQHRVIDFVELFQGTLTQTSVYPREVAKAALRMNAAAVILAHNHPSGVAEPSIQDQSLTRTLGETLALVDCKVLDHIIIGTGTFCSFAERGMI